MTRLRAIFGGSCALFVLALSACGSSETAAPAPVIEETTFASALNVNLATSTKLPSGMYYRDLVVGAGATVATGDSVFVHYTGWFVNGSQFDINVATQAPVVFKLGVGRVIEGWDLGVVGMRVGGQRQLIIPPNLGYGSSDYNGIPGNSILVFSVSVANKK
jgi:peptidylprolyl isomerase